jgi:hypothetical protein
VNAALRRDFLNHPSWTIPIHPIHRSSTEFAFKLLPDALCSALCCMKWKRLLNGSTLSVVGFLLSPLSWWNDLFVNVPLALAFARVISLFYPPAFSVSFILGYWMTNVLGLILMQKGGEALLSRNPGSYDRKKLIRDIAVSLAYTVAIALLIKFKIVQPLPNYFPDR